MALTLFRRGRQQLPENSTPLPEPGFWQIDPSHSAVELSVRHLGTAKVRGRFHELAGSIEVADDPVESHVEVEIKTASLDTGDARRDEHLRSDDFFAVERYPKATFRSTALRLLGGDRYGLDGELTVRGVTRPLQLELTYGGVVTDPYGNQRIVFSARGEVNREEFGLTWNQVLETGGLLVGTKVRLEIDIEAVREG
ncbi:MAG TPA: YceI family protein [Acidimicrobiales bacterium]|nr:YceI family protein [Acidimicrobiales bacterium]